PFRRATRRSSPTPRRRASTRSASGSPSAAIPTGRRPRTRRPSRRAISRSCARAPPIGWTNRTRTKAPKADGSGLEEVGFTDLRWFALRSDASHPADDRMRQYQKNVIDWTIKWLWCYDNVWWEIANEPERADVDPILAAQWQQQMIAHTQQTEKTYPRLTAR